MTPRTSWRAGATGIGMGIGTLLLIGLPTAILPNPWFTRMTPTRPQDYLILGLTVLLAAGLGATYAAPAACSLHEGKLTAGGVLAFLAVGCPVCNKVVVLLLGTGGALAYFEPVQPLLAVTGLGLLGGGLALRLRALHSFRQDSASLPPTAIPRR